MVCDGCGNDKAYRLRFAEGGVVCNHCGGLGQLAVPDVYFKKPYYDYNLAHPNRPWEAEKGAFVESRRHKAALLREQGLVERGDRRHGSINFDKKLAERVRER